MRRGFILTRATVARLRLLPRSTVHLPYVTKLEPYIFRGLTAHRLYVCKPRVVEPWRRARVWLTGRTCVGC